jgi:hypothetical protein
MIHDFGQPIGMHETQGESMIRKEQRVNDNQLTLEIQTIHSITVENIYIGVLLSQQYRMG